MTIREKKVFETDDGKQFETARLAENHARWMEFENAWYNSPAANGYEAPDADEVLEFIQSNFALITAVVKQT